MKKLTKTEWIEKFNEDHNNCNVLVEEIHSECPDCKNWNITNAHSMWRGWINSFPSVEMECEGCGEEYVFKVDGFRLELQYYKKTERKLEPDHFKDAPPVPPRT